LASLIWNHRRLRCSGGGKRICGPWQRHARAVRARKKRHALLGDVARMRSRGAAAWRAWQAYGETGGISPHAALLYFCKAEEGRWEG
jgi:hypothetical protein